MASVIHINPEEPQVELTSDEFLVHAARFRGTILEVARDLELQGDPFRLGRLLRDAVEVGATVLRNGQSRALVESVALEIDRLIETAVSESEKIPQALQEPLGEHLTKLADLLAQHFDPQRARSLQAQIKTLVGEATGVEVRKHVRDLLSDDGAIGSHVRLFTSSNAELLTRVNSVLDKLEQKVQLDQQIDRSPHKGRPFEEIVQAELEALHTPLGDIVLCVRSDYGLVPKTSKGAKAGDFVVIVNPSHARGRELSYVVEVKTGPLRAGEAKRELEMAIRNRGAVAGVLVFDSVDDAPLGGRTFMHHGDGRLTAVLDVESGFPFAFEVACKQARELALVSLKAEGELDPSWIQEQCNQLCEIVEAASAMLRSVGAVERGATDIRDIYTTMRLHAFTLIDEMRKRCE